MKNIFYQGAIPSILISESLDKHASKTNIGAHSMFLGQIRSDIKDNKQVVAIDYTSFEPLALEMMNEIREDIFSKYALTCMHIYHSLGRVNVGEICLFVFTSSPHRKAAIEACSEVVEKIKKDLPSWGKEILEDESHNWKVNI
jgi:molybdopterin synthase catalytic subunit